MINRIKQYFKSQATKEALREWIETIVIAVILAMFVRTFFVELFKIPTGSMQPTLLIGDRILVNKMIYGPRIPFIGKHLPGFTKPKRGDIIVFISPKEPAKNLIKRLIGLPGESVEIKIGSLYINGKLLDNALFQERYYYNRGKFGQEDKSILVPADSYFVLGDNSGSSEDSRYWGFLPAKNVLGKALAVYWPFNRFRILK